MQIKDKVCDTCVLESFDSSDDIGLENEEIRRAEGAHKQLGFRMSKKTAIETIMNGRTTPVLLPSKM